MECAVVGGGQALEPEISEFELWSALLVLRWIGAYCLIFQGLALQICKMKIVPPLQGCQEDKRSLRHGWSVYTPGFPHPRCIPGSGEGKEEADVVCCSRSLGLCACEEGKEESKKLSLKNPNFHNVATVEHNTMKEVAYTSQYF